MDDKQAKQAVSGQPIEVKTKDLSPEELQAQIAAKMESDAIAVEAAAVSTADPKEKTLKIKTDKAAKATAEASAEKPAKEEVAEKPKIKAASSAVKPKAEKTASEADSEKSESEKTLSPTQKKVIAPLSDVQKADKSADSASQKPEAAAPTAKPAVDGEVKSTTVDPQASDSTTEAAPEGGEAAQKLDAMSGELKAREDEKAKKKAGDASISVHDTKEYHLPIKPSRHNKQHAVHPVVSVLIILLAVLLFGAAAVDIGFIDPGFELPFDLL